MPCDRRSFHAFPSFPALGFACLLVGSAEGAVQVAPGPPPENNQAATHIREVWKATLSDYTLSTSTLTEANVPRVVNLLAFGEPPHIVTLYAAGKLLIVDAASGGIKHAFDVPPAKTLIKTSRLPDFLLSYEKDDMTYVSRIDTATGKPIWTTKHDHRGFVADDKGKRLYSVPLLYRELPDGRHISLLGIRGSRQLMQTTVGRANDAATLSIIDLESGTLVRDDRFDLRRVLNDSLLFFYRDKDRRFEIYDLKTGTTVGGGTTLKDDVRAMGGGLMSQSRRAPVVEIPQLAEMDVAPILTDNQLLITSRDYTLGFPIQSYDVKASWVRFDLQGKRLEKLEPAPKSAGDFSVNNVGSRPWPLILGHFKKGSQYAYCKLDKFLRIDERGEISDLPVPKIAGESNPKYRKDAWFHDDSHMFALVDGSLFKWEIGKADASAIFVSPAETKYEDVVAADSRYAVLARFKDAVLVRLEDGRVVDPKDFNASLSTALWRQALDLKRSHSELPREGVPAQFKKYVPLDDVWILPASGATTEDGHQPTARLSIADTPSYAGYQYPRIWGGYTEKYGDVLLAPCLLKDGSARLIGIRLPEHTVLFSVPILGVKDVVKGAYDGGYFFPFDTFELDEKESLLVVFEGLKQVRAYRVSRPE